jgi:hypothetical protein
MLIERIYYTEFNAPNEYLVLIHCGYRYTLRG